MRVKAISVKKSRSIKLGRNETWIGAEITATFQADEEITEEKLQDLYEAMEAILKSEEEMEHDRWNDSQNQRRQQQNRENIKSLLAANRQLPD